MTIAPSGPVVIRETMTRIPTPSGEFQLALYSGSADNKEHLALVIGDVNNKEDVLIRIHSECFTGDVLGSLRCDCGEQLERAMQEISAAGRGVILYLRQEGRGIGLLEKLRAYNLQDLGHDTVDANLMLGHEADARDYTVAAQILEDLGVRSVQVLTNNPLKITALEELGVSVSRRVPIEIDPSPDNLAYLRTKANRMSHMLAFGTVAANMTAPNGNGQHSHNGNGHHATHQNGNGHTATNGNGNGNGHQNGASSDPAAMLPVVIKKFTRPAVTISYAQSVDGSIAGDNGQQVTISGKQSMTMTHRLRAGHDAILVGIGTALSDDPRLTVRLVAGSNPQPIIVDSTLRLEPDASVFTAGHNNPWIVTTENHDPQRRAAVEAAGATVIQVPATDDGRVDLGALLDDLGGRGISSLMVEGGAGIIRSFLDHRLVDQLVITVSPQLIGGTRVLEQRTSKEQITYPTITGVHYQRLGDDIVMYGRPVWETP
jgi:GTP cyclohydrolase II